MSNIKELLSKIDANQKIIGSNRPLEQKQIENLRDYYKIGFVYASNAIEGSTLTLSETKVVVEDGVTIGGKPLRDHLDAIGNARAFEYIWGLSKQPIVTENTIQEIHRICFQPKEGEAAGQYRKLNVVITGSAYNHLIPNHTKLPEIMADFASKLPSEQKEKHPVVYAAKLHRDFVYIHPFSDGNGRVARILMNHALLVQGYPVIIIPPGFKIEYIDALEKSHKQPDIFIDYIAERFIEVQKEYIRLLRIE